MDICRRTNANMSQSWGISLRYHQHEASWAALQLADLARDSGIPVKLYGSGVCKREMSPYWDARVTDGQKEPFEKWLEGCTRVIWTVPPTPAELTCAKQMGVVTMLLVDWELLQQEDEPQIRDIDTLILPHRCVAEAVCRWGSAMPAHFYPFLMPWDVLTPVTKPREKESAPTIYVPLHDSQAAKSNLAVFNVIHGVLEQMPKVRAIVTGGARWSLRAVRAVRRLKRLHGDRFHFTKQPRPAERLEILGKAHLMVWPACYENFGLVGLDAISMGVPVVAWDVPPLTEFLQNQQNALLVPCQHRHNWLGVPCAIGDYTTFGRAVVSLLQNSQLLATMRATSRKGLQARKDQFMQMWTTFST